MTLPSYSLPFSSMYDVDQYGRPVAPQQPAPPQQPPSSGPINPIVAQYIASQATAPAAPAAPTIIGAARTPAAASQIPAAPTAISASRIPAAGMFSSYFPAGSEIAGMGTLSQVALPAAGAYGLYNLFDKFGQRKPLEGAASGAAAGAALGSIVPGVGTLIGGGAGAALGGLVGMIKAGKHKDQIARDGVRSRLQQMGFVDNDYNIALADGSRFNIGVDGGQRPYNVDTSQPMAAQAVGWADPLAEIISGGDDKLRSDFSGYLANAAMSNATSIEGVRANVLAMMENLGLNESSIRQNVAGLLADGRITQEQHDAYQNAIGTLIAGDPKLYVMGQPAQSAPTEGEAAPQPLPRPQVSFSEQMGA